MAKRSRTTAIAASPPTCSACVCWKRCPDEMQQQGLPEKGNCRAHPPFAERGGEKHELIMTTWPITFATEWCREFSPATD